MHASKCIKLSIKKNLLSTFKHYNVAMIRRFSLTSIVKIVIHTHTQTDTHTHIRM